MSDSNTSSPVGIRFISYVQTAKQMFITCQFSLCTPARPPRLESGGWRQSTGTRGSRSSRTSGIHSSTNFLRTGRAMISLPNAFEEDWSHRQNRHVGLHLHTACVAALN